LTMTRTVAVDGVTFHVRAAWGVMRAFTRRLAEIEAAELGERGREAAAEDAARELLGQIVVGWDRDEGWSPERLDELDAATVAELLRRVGGRPEELGPKKDLSG
jgi:hypothetical protein